MNKISVLLILVLFLYIVPMLLMMLLNLGEEIMDVLNLENPLWRLPIYIFWPISIVGMVLFIFPILAIIKYIREIKQYYQKRVSRRRLPKILPCKCGGGKPRLRITEDYACYGTYHLRCSKCGRAVSSVTMKCDIEYWNRMYGREEKQEE